MSDDTLPPERIAEIEALVADRRREADSCPPSPKTIPKPSRRPPAHEEKSRSNGAAAPNHPVPEPHSGQVRMAYRLASAHQHRLLHVHGIGWHYWDGTRWADDDIGAATQAVLDVLRTALTASLGDKDLQRDVRRCESDSGINGVLNIASALVEFAATVRDLDADPYLLNMANGTLDLRTMECRSHDPADRITKVTRAAYDRAAKAVVWTEFLDHVLPDGEVREYLQRIAGVALLGKVIEHVLPILTGTGRNGKSTFYEAMIWALGDYASTADPDLFMHRQNAHPTGEMDLMGRRLVVVSESEEGRRLDEAKMKRLTGGDPVKARRMRQDFVEFVPSHLPMLITNHLPKVSGDSPATWSRLRVIPFDVVIPKRRRDTGLGDALQAEADAVLAWALAGWVQYREKKLDEPAAVLQATDAYQLTSDAVRRFIDDRCVTTSPALKATTGQLHDEWAKWAIEDGAKPMSQKAFGQALDRHGYPAGPVSNSKRWRVGIALRVTDDDA